MAADEFKKAGFEKEKDEWSRGFNSWDEMSTALAQFPHQYIERIVIGRPLKRLDLNPIGNSTRVVVLNHACAETPVIDQTANRERLVKALNKYEPYTAGDMHKHCIRLCDLYLVSDSKDPAKNGNTIAWAINGSETSNGSVLISDKISWDADMKLRDSDLFQKVLEVVLFHRTQDYYGAYKSFSVQDWRLRVTSNADFVYCELIWDKERQQWMVFACVVIL